MSFERSAFNTALGNIPDSSNLIDLKYVEAKLSLPTAPLAKGAIAICVFVTDRADASMLSLLHGYGVKLLALRYAGSATVDLEKAADLGIKVARVPEHSPACIAEYAVTLMLMLTRKLPAAADRLRSGVMSHQELLGVELTSCTVGVLGTGLVGRCVVTVLRTFGCRVLAYDTNQQQEVLDAGAEYVTLSELLQQSDLLSLHAPLLPSTLHIIGTQTLARCKPGVLVVNTARGALVHNGAMLSALENGAVGGYALDVFEGEANVFFRDNVEGTRDPYFETLKAMPNVFITGHQAEMSKTAVNQVAKATMRTLIQFKRGEKLEYEVFATEDD